MRACVLLSACSWPHLTCGRLKKVLEVNAKLQRKALEEKKAAAAAEGNGAGALPGIEEDDGALSLPAPPQQLLTPRVPQPKRARTCSHSTMLQKTRT